MNMHLEDMPADERAMAREAARQQAVLQALWAEEAGLADTVARLQSPGFEDAGCRAAPISVADGLQAYRRNGRAHATQALAAAYPTVQALLGAEDFARLAQELWQAHPPVQGDLARWGEPLGGFLATHPELTAWPYLADCAWLDWAVHCCERAADAQFDAPSMSRLTDTDAQQLRLLLRPGLSVRASRWPVWAIHQAHRAGAAPEAMEQALEHAREALQAGVGECVLVCRQGWRAEVYRIDAATVRWTQRLLAGDTLATALDALADEMAQGQFELGRWLGDALAAGWLKGIAVADD